MADKAQKEKEKGNAAFKAGDYPSAIGHYTAAVLADRRDSTYPLNRAAAYLKLGKYEDAERDCNTVLSLSVKNVKAHFRRGQAKVGLGKYIEAQRDFTEALRLEPDNQAAKAELEKITKLTEAEKRRKPSVRQVDATFDSTLHPAPTPKRRRVPITIVEPSNSPPNDTATTSEVTNPVEEPRKTASLIGVADIQESSSRRLKSSVSGPESEYQSTSQTSTSTSTPTSLPTSSAPVSSSPTTAPKATSFAQAKQAREAKKSKVGGGIFRASGQNTVFPTGAEGSSSSPPGSSSPLEETLVVKTQDEENSTPIGEPSPRSKIPSTSITNNEPLDESPTSPGNSDASNQPLVTLFDLIRAWRSVLTSTERWKLLQTIPPSSMPSLCKTSLDPTLLVSILEVFLVVLCSQPTADDTSRIGEYMDNLTKVPRFPTLVMFLNGKEKAIAKEVWRKLGVQGKPSGAWNILGDLSS